MRPSLTLVFSALFVAFIGHSIWSLVTMFRAPTCDKNEVCYHSFLNKNPNLQLNVYISDGSRSGNIPELVYSERNFEWSKPLEKELTVELTKNVRKNGSLVIHSVIIPKRKNSEELSLREAIRDPVASVIKGYLTQYAVPKSYAFNLLKEQGKEQSVKPVTHIKSRYGVLMCTEELHIPHAGIPLEVVRHLRVNNNYEVLPIVLEDIMQTRLKDLIEITDNSKTVTFTYVYSPVAFGKLRFLLQIEATLKQFLTLGFTEKDLDEIRGVFADTNLYLLCATMAIGSIHLLLDFLSFKNDVSFWKTHRSMAGLSRRTVLWRAFSQTVVFLYLLDEGTSLLVLIPAGVGTIIEFWKVKKVLKASITWEGGLKLKTDTKETKAEAQTRQYDDECMRYLSYILYPLCTAAAIYSLLYQPHKSWYSWTINSLVNGVYAFGFIFMLPQLFVNYRLKSVAALPWRAFTYRAFNTFIDDIFAFIITMPTAHRVACFRDDVVFLIYLYQRWLYPVDKSRTEDTGDETVVEEKKTK